MKKLFPVSCSDILRTPLNNRCVQRADFHHLEHQHPDIGIPAGLEVSFGGYHSAMNMKGTSDVLRRGEVHQHCFSKDKTGSICAVCKNLWLSQDKITSRYQICAGCGVNIHTNCRSAAQTCIPCVENMSVSYSQGFKFKKATGWLFVKVLHIFDVNVAPGTPMYAQVRFKHGTQCLRSITAESGNNECLWEAVNPEIPVQHTSLKFQVNQDNIPADVFKDELRIEVEVWSSFLSFFDTCMATADVVVSPVLLFPNSVLERWFPLINRVSPDGILGEGKLLLSMSYQPISSTVSADSSSNLSSSSLDYFSDRSRSASQASVPDVLRTPDSARLQSGSNSESGKKNYRADSLGGSSDGVHRTQQSIDSSVEQGKGGSTHDPVTGSERRTLFPPEHVGAIEISSTHDVVTKLDIAKEKLNKASVDGEEIINEAKSVAKFLTDNKVQPVPTADDLCQLPFQERNSIVPVPAVVATVGVAAMTEAVIPGTFTASIDVDASRDLASSAAPKKDFYEAIAEFTERTTNTIGTFFYEMEALNLSGATKETVDGDWDDNTAEKLHGSSIYSMDSSGGSKGDNATAKLPVDKAPALGVGYMHIHVISAFKTKVKDVADGDHYILACVEDSRREFKSKSVYHSATPIFNVRWTIKMENFHSAVSLYLVDAYSHRKIASTRFTCFALMQRDADRHIHSYKDAPKEKYALKNLSDGADMGHLTARVAFEEDLEHLFLGSELHDAPNPPPEPLSVQRLGVHIARFGAIIELINLWYAEFLFLTEWRDPFTTLIVFLAFLYFTIKVSAEYALSGVMFTVVVLMTRTLIRRRSGAYVKHYVELGVQAIPKLDYKPVGKLRLSVLGFRGGDSLDATAFVKPSMKVTYLPMPESMVSPSTSQDAVPIEHTVGYFGPTEYGVGFAVPEVSQGVSQLVSNMVGAEVVQRDAVLQNLYDPWPLSDATLTVEDKKSMIPADTPDLSLVYPILQPIAARTNAAPPPNSSSVVEAAAASKRNNPTSETELSRSGLGNTGSSTDSELLNTMFGSGSSSIYLPWHRNESTIKIAFIDDQHSSFGGSTEEYVAFSIKDIAMKGKLAVVQGKPVLELKKWCKVRKPTGNGKAIKAVDSVGELDLFAYDSASSIYMSSTDRDSRKLSLDAGIKRQLSIVPPGAQVLVRVQLEVPQLTALAAPSVEEQESSLVLQSLLQDPKKPTSSTISVLWNMTDNVKYVQNLLNWLLDQIESVKNIFNWTSPSKTYPIYLAIVAIWLVTVIVPGRLLILSLGLYEFLFIFLPIPEGRNNIIRFSNLIQSIPNDDDIAQIYDAERKEFATVKGAEWKATERTRKVNLTLATRWKGEVRIKASSLSASSGVAGEWVEVFMLLQGQRLVWWASEEEFEVGKAASGQLLLGSHAGITQVSPVDIRKHGGEERLLAVFGQDYTGRPQKLDVLFADAEAKLQVRSMLEKK